MGNTATPNSRSTTATMHVKSIGSIVHTKLLVFVLLLSALDVQSFSSKVPRFLRRILSSNDDADGAFKVKAAPQPVGGSESNFVGAGTGMGMVDPHPPDVPPSLELLIAEEEARELEGASTTTFIDGTPFFLGTEPMDDTDDSTPTTETYIDEMVDIMVKDHMEENAPAFPSLENDPWFELTVAMLKAELKSRGLHITGTKPELVAKLIESDAEMEIYEREKLQRDATGYINENILRPFTSKEIEHGVDRETITGAAMSAVTFIALASGGNAFCAGAAGIGAAYMAISPGAAGNAFRWFGKKAARTFGGALGIWNKVDEGDQLQKTTGALFGHLVNAVVENRRQNQLKLDEMGNSEELAKAQAVEAKARRLLETRLALETILRERRSKTKAEATGRRLLEVRFQFEANARFATETRLAVEAEEARLAIELKLADENRALEEARRAEAVALAEEDLRFEQARLAEEARLAQEAIIEEQERIAEQKARAAEIARNEEEARIEEVRVAEEARVAEETRIEQEAKLAEEARIEQEAILAEETRIADEAKLAEEARIEQEARVAEETRIEQEAKLAEEARIEQEARVAEETRIAHEAKLAEEARIEQETKLAEEARIEKETKLAEEARIAQEAKLAEEARVEQEAKLAREARIEEEDRLAEEAHTVEEARLAAEAEATLAEEARRAVELAEKVRQKEAAATKSQKEATVVEDDDFSEQDWEESIRAAQESIEESIVGFEDSTVDDSEKATWEAARNLAHDLREPSSVADDDEFDMAAMARAAREAVEAFESARQPRGQDNELARAARAAVEQVESTPEPSQDWSKLTVVKLKEELSSRGLPTTGKKAGLVAALKGALKGKKAGLVDALKESDLMLGNAGQAQDELDESAEELQPLDSSDEELEELARAARAAVEQFEATATVQDPAEDFDEDNLDFSDLDMEEIGRAARQAVEMFDGEDEPSDEVLWQLENEQEELLALPKPSKKPASKTDFASMKVTELKEELRIRGLPMGGKKADLIERLKAL